jgi:hypothetical protein
MPEVLPEKTEPLDFPLMSDKSADVRIKAMSEKLRVNKKEKRASDRKPARLNCFYYSVSNPIRSNIAPLQMFYPLG